MIFHFYMGGALALCLLITSFLRRQFKLRNYPSAPGPALAKYTDLWYVWKVWDCKFQYWNIEQHAKHGTTSPSSRLPPGDPGDGERQLDKQPMS